MDRYLTLWHPYTDYPGLFIGSYPPAALPQLPANHLYYLRYRFKLDATVNPATYKLQFPANAHGLANLRADDRVVGVYLNGKRMMVTPAGALSRCSSSKMRWPMCQYITVRS